MPKGLNSWHANNPKFKYAEKVDPTEEEKKKEEEDVMGPLETYIDFKCENIKYEELEHDYKDNVPWKLGQGL